MARILPIIIFLLQLAIAGPCAYGQNDTGRSGSSRPDSKNAFYKNATYLWPTDASPYLSGTFGETRSQHFHSALDIKTWGRKGYKILATRDGTLHRMAIGPKGYGRVLYLHHPDGSYSVYAHLLSFNDRIQQLADSIRMRDYSYELDRVVDSLHISVEQGEVIGYSGASGVGPPHLHFELRTPSQKPFNPLLTNLSVPDDIPPRFSAISLEPLSAHTQIEGNHRIYIRKTAQNNGGYDFGTIKVSGPVGLGVDLFDQANRVRNAYAVYDLKLFADSTLIFHSRVDSFSYEQTDQMFLDRVYPILQQTGQGYQRLYTVEGNTLPFYRSLKNRGVLNLPAGRHKIRMVGEDYFGNRSEARLVLDVKGRPEPGTMLKPPDRDFQRNPNSFAAQQLDRWDWHPDWIRFNNPDSSTYGVIALDTLRNSLASLSRVQTALNLREHARMIIENSNGNRIRLQRMIPDQPNSYTSTRDHLFARFPAQTFYDTLSAGMVSREFRRDSVRVDLYPNNQPLRKEFSLTYTNTFAPGPADSTLAFYQWNKRRGKLYHVPTTRTVNDFEASVPALGTYYLLADTTAPEVSKPRIHRREDGRWVATVTATDNRSGIDHKASVFMVNGVRGIAEYAPEDDLLHYYHPEFRPDSTNYLKIVVEDNIGNKTVREFTVSHR